MQPTLESKQIALFRKSRRYKAGQIVVASLGDKEIVKRILLFGDKKVYLQGDNHASGDYFVELEDLKGRLILKLKSARQKSCSG